VGAVTEAPAYDPAVVRYFCPACGGFNGKGYTAWGSLQAWPFDGRCALCMAPLNGNPGEPLTLQAFGDEALCEELRRVAAPHSLAYRGADPRTVGPCDLAISARLAAIVRPRELAVPRLGWLNLHLGKLPEHRGVRPIAYAILEGDDAVVVTWHRMVEEVDAGPIVSEARIPIRPEDDAADLYWKALDVAAVAFRDIVRAGVEARVLAARPQTGAPRTRTRREWARLAAEYERWERAFAWR
jgi:methionyl-tRNA formyltransferase